MLDSIYTNTKKVFYYTFGCKLNFTETSSIKQCFLDNGFSTVRKGESPDIIIVNTCSVTENAEKKCRRMIRRIKHIYPKSFLMVTGCYAKLRKDEIAAMKEVNVVVGLDPKYLVNFFIKKNIKIKNESSSSWLKNFIHSYSYKEKTRGFLKIQDGCDYRCSYCTIPLARGRSRNGLVLDLFNITQKMLLNGVKEIVLTGINIGDFGKSTNESLLDLIRQLDTIQAKVRFRISSIEPNLLTDELISFISYSNSFVPHFHIPLQSGCNDILQLMKRKYTTSFFRNKVEKIKTKLPNAFIGLDVIVGMRSETQYHFDETRKFLADLPFSQLHVFPYSDRPGTEALKLQNPVPQKEKQVRTKVLLDLSNKRQKEFYNSQIGMYHRVLFEHSKKNRKMYGFTDNYLRIEAGYSSKQVNKFSYGTLSVWNENKTALTINLKKNEIISCCTP